MSINNKDWNAVSSLFRPSREVSKNDPTLKIGQIHTCLITGAVSRLYNQRNGKNYWMTGEKVNGKNGRCNTQFRADRNGTIVPTEAVAWGKHVQSMDKSIWKGHFKSFAEAKTLAVGKGFSSQLSINKAKSSASTKLLDFEEDLSSMDDKVD